MDISAESTIDLSDEVSYPDPDISLDTEDPDHFRVDDDDHDIVRRDATPRSTTAEPPTEFEPKRKRSEDMEKLTDGEQPSAKRSETSFEIARIASAFCFPKTTDAAGAFSQVLQAEMTEKLEEELQAQAKRLDAKHDEAMIKTTEHLTAEITELRSKLEEKAAQLKESEASLVRLTHSERKNSELYEKLKMAVAAELYVENQRHQDKVQSISAQLAQRADSSDI